MQIFLGLNLLLCDCSSTQNHKHALDEIVYWFLRNCKKNILMDVIVIVLQYEPKMYYSDKKCINDFLFGETDEMQFLSNV